MKLLLPALSFVACEFTACVERERYTTGHPVEPGFRRGRFACAGPWTCYLDVSGWGMGEVWINDCYLGSFWDEERQRSIRIPDGLLRPEENTLVVFDLKNCDPTSKMHLSSKPVFD